MSLKLTQYAEDMLRKFYMQSYEGHPSETFSRACRAYSGRDFDLAERLQEYLNKGWFMFSSPALSNAPEYGQSIKALPISCYLQYVPNSIKGLVDHSTEERYLTVSGGGIGAHWSGIQALGSRMRDGGKHPGMMGFLHTHDADMLAYRQGSTRRGSYAAFLHVGHPEVMEFIGMRVPTGGDINKKNLNLHHGVCIDDAFMQAVKNDEMWKLVDPRTQEVMETVKARVIWQQILVTRYRTGEPFIIHVDEANRKLNPALKAKGKSIHGSNLCTEIYLPTSEDSTAVCCLSSVNLATYDEWKDSPTFIDDMVTMLDNILDVFIENAPEALAKAVNSAKSERNIGLGAMGWHTYLTGKGVPWESALALSINRSIFRNMYDKAVAASKRLAIQRGEAPDLQGTGRRHGHLLAIAPNANSSVILSVSPSIEPEPGMAYTRDTRAGASFYRNPALAALFESKYPEHNTEATWSSIIAHEGSVQHLEFLSEEEKKVFKTAYEIDQKWVVLHARSRQEYIDQGQSVNLFFPRNSGKAEVNAAHWAAFDPDSDFDVLKGLYYLRSDAAATADRVAVKLERKKIESEECIACQG